MGATYCTFLEFTRFPVDYQGLNSVSTRLCQGPSRGSGPQKSEAFLRFSSFPGVRSGRPRHLDPCGSPSVCSKRHVPTTFGRQRKSARCAPGSVRIVSRIVPLESMGGRSPSLPRPTATLAGGACKKPAWRTRSASWWPRSAGARRVVGSARSDRSPRGRTGPIGGGYRENIPDESERIRPHG